MGSDYLNFKKNPNLNFKNLSSLSKKQVKHQIKSLTEGIEYHNYLYYVKNSPVISDYVYDSLFKRLQKLEDAFPEFASKNSPTRRVGALPSGKFKKMVHSSAMLSLDAVLKENEVEDFHERIKKNTGHEEIKYVTEPKFDGFSVEVVYEKGEFKYASTRGDGFTGEDISENLRTIKSVPLRLMGNLIPDMLAVRAEVFMPVKGFHELNKKKIKEGLEPMANPRNAAAGLMRQKKPADVAGKPLDIFFYDILSIKGCEFNFHWEILQQFPKWGLKTNPFNSRHTGIESVKKYYYDLESKRDEMDFEIDGMVIKLDDIRLRKSLGEKQRSPRWAVAWKFKPKTEITVLKDIIVQVGKSGMLTPVALLDPVQVGGVTVSRATLHNEEEVRNKDIFPGDRVKLARAGDVIPEIIKKVEEKKSAKRKKFTMPSRCPSCGSKVYKEGAYYFCPSGLSCKAQLVGRIKHYASRDALNIENLGIRTVEELVNKNMVKNIADLYVLTVEDFLTLEGFALKSATSLYEALQQTKNPSFDRFLYALGIRHIGVRISKVLAEHFGSLDNIIKADLEELQSVNEIGPEIAQSTVNFFTRKKNIDILDRLFRNGFSIKQKAQKKAAGKLQGKRIVFTGELQNYTRNQVKEKAEKLGARIVSSVSKNTDYLIAGKNPGSKLKQAEEKNVKIITENQFEELIK